jgi:hypothetical protein
MAVDPRVAVRRVKKVVRDRTEDPGKVVSAPGEAAAGEAGGAVGTAVQILQMGPILP